MNRSRRQLFVGLHVVVKIAIFTQLRHYVAVIYAEVHI